VALLELYGTRSCPYTAEIRADLEWRGEPFVEFDVETDPDARTRLVSLSGGNQVPVLAQGGRVVRIGWNGRCCYAGPVRDSAI
jgi:mycoredoxin